MTILSSFLAVGLFANISSDLFDCDKKKLVRGQVLIIPSVCGWQNATPLCNSLFIVVVLVCVLILLYIALMKDGTISLIEF